MMGIWFLSLFLVLVMEFQGLLHTAYSLAFGWGFFVDDENTTELWQLCNYIYKDTTTLSIV